MLKNNYPQVIFHCFFFIPLFEIKLQAGLPLHIVPPLLIMAAKEKLIMLMDSLHKLVLFPETSLPPPPLPPCKHNEYFCSPRLQPGI